MLRPELSYMSPGVRDLIARRDLLRASAAGARRTADAYDIEADALNARIHALVEGEPNHA